MSQARIILDIIGSRRAHTTEIEQDRHLLHRRSTYLLGSSVGGSLSDEFVHTPCAAQRRQREKTDRAIGTVAFDHVRTEFREDPRSGYLTLI